jgi:hypothetical protein
MYYMRAHPMLEAKLGRGKKYILKMPAFEFNI